MVGFFSELLSSRRCCGSGCSRLSAKPGSQAARPASKDVIDDAIVSSLCHHQPFLPGRLPQWQGVWAVPRATLELQLVCHLCWQGVWDETVLLPNAQVMPLLHQQLEASVSGLEVPPRIWQEPTLWLEQQMAPASWCQEQGMVRSRSRRLACLPIRTGSPPACTSIELT